MIAEKSEESKMLRLMILAMMTFASIAAAADKQTVVFSSSDGFSVMANAIGIASRGSKDVTINFDNATLSKNPRFPSPTRVVSYRVGIARDNGTAGWDTKSWSKAVNIDKTMFDNQALDLGKPTFTIPIERNVPLRDSWLVIEIALVAESGAQGTAYAHSNKLTMP
jgi:hypothetical protein